MALFTSSEGLLTEATYPNRIRPSGFAGFGQTWSDSVGLGRIRLDLVGFGWTYVGFCLILFGVASERGPKGMQYIIFFMFL